MLSLIFKSSFSYFNSLKFQKIISYLLYFLPLALVTGPFFADLFLSLIALYFLIISIINKLWSYYKNPFVYFFSLFYFYLLMRSLLSSDVYYSLEGCLFYFRYLFFSLGVFYLFDKEKFIARNLGLSLLVTLSIVAADAYYQWITGFNIFGWSSGVPTRLSGFFRDELIIGGYLARLTPLCLALLIYSYSSQLTKIKVFTGLIFLIFIDVITFGSGERAAFFFITLFSVMLVILSNNFKLYRLITFIVSTIIIIFISISVPSSNSKVKETLNQITTNTSLPLAPYSPLHEQHYIIGFKMFFDSPFFGKGPNMFDALCEKPEFSYHSGCTNHPHNSYVQLLAETGIIGFTFLLAAFFTVSLLLFRHFINMYWFKSTLLPDYVVFLLAGLFIMTWPLIPTGSFYNNWTNVMYYFPVGFVLHYFYKNRLL